MTDEASTHAVAPQRIQLSRKWIAVTDRLPDHDGHVWEVRTADGDETLEFYHFHEGWATDVEITHWRPLQPNNPSEVADEV